MYVATILSIHLLVHFFFSGIMAFEGQNSVYYIIISLSQNFLYISPKYFPSELRFLKYWTKESNIYYNTFNPLAFVIFSLYFPSVACAWEARIYFWWPGEHPQPSTEEWQLALVPPWLRSLVPQRHLLQGFFAQHPGIQVSSWFSLF